LLALISAVVCESFWPEDDKRFFYMDLIHEENPGNVHQSVYVFKVDIVNQETGKRESYKLLPTSNEQGIEIASEDCQGCSVFDFGRNQIDINDPAIKIHEKSKNINGYNVN